MKGATVKGLAPTVLPFPCASSSGRHRARRRELLSAIRLSGSPVIVDFSGCCTLNHDDVDLLLECVALVAGRDTQVFFAAGSRVIRVLLEVLRISSLVTIFNTVEEALLYPATEANRDPAADSGVSQSQEHSGVRE